MEADERPSKLLKTSHDTQNFDPQLALDLQSQHDVLAEAGEVTSVSHKLEVEGTGTPLKPSDADDQASVLNHDGSVDSSVVPDAQSKPLSKNQMKKLKREREWEAGREARKAFKKEKRKAAQARKREARDAALDQTVETDKAPEESTDASVAVTSQHHLHSQRPRPIQVPVTILFDCDFDECMTPKEIVSLTAQITRSYSDNSRARYRAHMAISSFGGRMKTRLETVLANHHESWKGVRFYEEDFVEVAAKAKLRMQQRDGGKVAGALARNHTELSTDLPVEASSPPANRNDAESQNNITEDASVGHQDTMDRFDGEIVYLTADSENTLTELSPYSVYIIGGLVDKNRHKGICYKRACERSIKTARLPIGDYLKMSSRQVLTTNHVNEIMLKWFELGEWGAAFMSVIPKRKGGELLEDVICNENGEEAEGSHLEDGSNT